MGRIFGKPSRISDQENLSKELDAKARRKMKESAQVRRLLLLGPGESGKSTLFKQANIIYGDGFSQKERDGYVEVVRANVIDAIQSMLRQLAIFNLELDPANNEHLEIVKKTTTISEFNEIAAKAIHELWKDPALTECYRRRAEYQLIDSSDIFLDKVLELSKPDYKPSDEDMLNVRAKTSGILRTSISMKGVVVNLVDVGGQRNERKKWIHCFEDVTAVLFVVAVSEYDQMLFEDTSVFRMREALDLFTEVCAMEWFEDKPVILFLNKRDLFEEKYPNSPITCFFPEFKGNSCDQALEYIRQQFVQCNTNPNKDVFTYYSCATDVDNVEKLFEAMRGIILGENLERSGFIYLFHHQYLPLV